MHKNNFGAKFNRVKWRELGGRSIVELVINLRESS